MKLFFKDYNKDNILINIVKKQYQFFGINK